VVIRFVIGATGTVMASSVGDSSIPVPSVGECVANAVRRWQFPSPEGGGVVTVQGDSFRTGSGSVESFQNMAKKAVQAAVMTPAQ
jgi:outer membrane biosynthesis protein TonB